MYRPIGAYDTVNRTRRFTPSFRRAFRRRAGYLQRQAS
jgi:hypothetical protein